jgi:hypothetical protein
MILENTFCSISDMVDHIFPLLSYFKHLIQRIYWPSIDRIPNVRVPLLFIVGLSDEIVPANHVSRLFEAAKAAAFKQMYQVHGGMHNDTWYKGGKDYIYAIKDFIDKAQDHRANNKGGNEASGSNRIANTNNSNSNSNAANYSGSQSMLNQGGSVGVANSGA